MRYINTLFFLLTCTLGYAQAISFDVFMMGGKIGAMHISREVQADGTEHYIMETKSHAMILWINRSNHTRYEVFYKNGKMLSSTMKEIEDDKVKRWTNIKWDGTKYNVDGYKGKRSFVQSPATSIVTLFYKEPSAGSSVFYEAEGDFNILKNPEPHTWQFKSSDGQTNIYKYKNSKISDVEFHVSIATIKLVRTN